MLTGLRDQIRRYLGTDTIHDLEVTMATVLESLRSLAEQQRAASAAQLTSFSNLQSAVQRLETAVRDGEVSPEIESAVADLKMGFDTMLEAANRADDGHEPTPDVPAEPGTDTPPVEGEPTVPVEGDTGTDETTRTTRRR